MKKNEKLIVRIKGHYLNLTIIQSSHPEFLKCINSDCFDAHSCSDIIAQIVKGKERGEFSLSKYLMLENRKETLVGISGNWIRLPDYQQLNRIFMWEYNRSYNEILTEDMFKTAFGDNFGVHYYGKWKSTFNYSIPNMITYLRGNENEGQLFMAMIMQQVTKYEKRLEHVEY